MKRLIYLFLFSILIASCKKDSPNYTYSVTTSVTPEKSGSIKIERGVEEGTEIATLTATPKDEFQFLTWKGDILTYENPVKVYLTKDVNIIAEFQPQPHLLTINYKGSYNGQVKQTIVPAKRNPYTHGTVVKLTAEANGFYGRFQKWGGDLSGTDKEVLVTVDKEMTIDAYFTNRLIKTLGSRGADSAGTFFQFPNKNYVYSAFFAEPTVYFTDFPTGMQAYYIHQLDSLGNDLWKYRFYSPKIRAGSVKQLTSTSFIADGHSENGGNVESPYSGLNYFISFFSRITTNSFNNDKITFYPGNLQSKVVSDGIILFGSSDNSTYYTSNYRGLMDAVILKIDFNGNLLWKQQFGGSDIDHITGVAITSTGEIIATGFTCSTDFDFSNFNNTNSDGFVARISSSGTVNSIHKVGSSNSEKITELIRMDASGNIVVRLVDETTSNQFIKKLAIDGSEVWSTDITGMNYMFNIKNTYSDKVLCHLKNSFYEFNEDGSFTPLHQLSTVSNLNVKQFIYKDNHVVEFGNFTTKYLTSAGYTDIYLLELEKIPFFN